MINTQTSKVACCITYKMQPCNLMGINYNTPCNFNATACLKALLLQALPCNTLGNFYATQAENQCNFKASKIPEKLHNYYEVINHDRSKI